MLLFRLRVKKIIALVGNIDNQMKPLPTLISIQALTVLISIRFRF